MALLEEEQARLLFATHVACFALSLFTNSEFARPIGSKEMKRTKRREIKNMAEDIQGINVDLRWKKIKSI